MERYMERYKVLSNKDIHSLVDTLTGYCLSEGVNREFLQRKADEKNALCAWYDEALA
jgi:hypothetical protein